MLRQLSFQCGELFSGNKIIWLHRLPSRNPLGDVSQKTKLKPRTYRFFLAVDLKPLVDILDVAAHGVFAQIEFVCDLFVIETQRYVVEYFDLLRP